MAQETEGQRIAQARRRLGLTVRRDIGQAELARLIGVSGNTVVWNWEEDLKQPSDANRARLSRVLGVTEAYLRYGTEPMELPGWTPPDLALLDLPAGSGVDARAAVAKKSATTKKRRRA
jgi:transcriptional regulator with XRE-family HTH domain